MQSVREGYYKFVRWHDAEEYKKLGWILSDDLKGTVHGHYSGLFFWPFEGEPPLRNC